MASTRPITILRSVGFVTALSCLSLLSPVSRAQPANYGTTSDDRETIMGGSGGGAFDISCPAATYISGITVHSGAWIDSISAECRYLAPTKDHFQPGTPMLTPTAGGHGGSERLATCYANQYLGSIKFGFTRDGNKPKYLDYVQLNCRPMLPSGNPSTLCLDTGGNGCWDKHPNPGPYNGYGLAFESRCRSNQWGKALRGRAGEYVDALALSCEGKPN